MSWLKLRFEVLKDALEYRRFLLVPIYGTLVGYADAVLRAARAGGMGDLIGVPSWAIGVFASTLIILWWVIEYAVKLRKQIRGAKVYLSEVPAQPYEIEFIRREEGGKWERGFAEQVHAIKTYDGRIWDAVNGWRSN